MSIGLSGVGRLLFFLIRNTRKYMIKETATHDDADSDSDDDDDDDDDAESIGLNNIVSMKMKSHHN